MSNETRRPSEPASGSRGPSGASRHGRREHERRRDRSRYQSATRPFHERHRSVILALVAVAAFVVVGGFVFIRATSKVYACSSLLDPAPAATPLPNGSPAPLGQVEPDMGRSHVADGTIVRFPYCPPASGNHYASTLGPITPRYYTPDESTIPQGWIHNLEHGALVVLYSCDRGGCGDADQRALQDLFQDFPNSPVCQLPKGTVSPVITRFEDMRAPFAAIVWGRVLLQDKLDTARMLEFFQTQAELHNPEQQCPRPSASPGPSGSTSPPASESPSAGASGSPSASPSASPAPSPS